MCIRDRYPYGQRRSCIDGNLVPICIVFAVFSFAADILSWPRGIRAGRGYAPDAWEAVSYTHLDVYKRQPLRDEQYVLLGPVHTTYSTRGFDLK